MQNVELSGMSSQKGFQCSVCNKEFSRKFTLDMHILIHQGLKPHSCTICGRSFRQKGTLMRHKALHSTIALYQCHLCNKAYRQKNVYLHHLKYTHKTPTSNLDWRKSSCRKFNVLNVTSAPLNFEPVVNTSDRSVSMQASVSNDSSDLSLNLTTSNQSLEQEMYRKDEKMASSQNDSYWKCDFCGVVMKYNFVNCTRHAAMHKKDFRHRCCACSKLFYKKSDLAIHHTQCQTYLWQNKIPLLSTPENSTRSYELPCETRTAKTEDLTFTCIPCQQDFQTEDDFECHVKTHVQSVLGDCNSGNNSNSEEGSAEFEPIFMPFIENHSQLPIRDDSIVKKSVFDCGNPYELINTVATGANSVLNFMSNVNGENSSSKVEPQGDNTSSESWMDLKDLQKQNSTNLLEAKKKSNTQSKNQSLNQRNRQQSSLEEKPACSKIGPNQSENNAGPSVKSNSCKTKAFECQICKEVLKGRDEFAVHKLKHAQIYNFTCNICNSPFNCKYRLKQHIQHKHSKKFVCKGCAKTFSYRTLLQKHKKMCQLKGVGPPDFSKLPFEIPSVAPVIDLTRINDDNEKIILGIIPLKNAVETQNPKYGIPVLTLESIKKGWRNCGLPVVGQVSIRK